MASAATEARKALLHKLSDGKYASWEELYFSWYLDDLVDQGYVSHFEVQPPVEYFPEYWDAPLMTMHR